MGRKNGLKIWNEKIKSIRTNNLNECVEKMDWKSKMRQKNPYQPITWTNGSKKRIWNLKWDKKSIWTNNLNEWVEKMDWKSEMR